jgi:hypothetical protein
MNANEIYFTRNTKRAQRIGDTLVIVTDGARITVTLQDGAPADVKVTRAAKPATAPKAAAPAAAPKVTAPKATSARTTRAPKAAAPKATAAAPKAKTTAAANRARRAEVLPRVAARNRAKATA